MSNSIEIYSGNRNRELYPEVAYFEVPFAPTLQNAPPNQAQDPVINGPVIYKFALFPEALPQLGGNAQPGSDASSIVMQTFGFLTITTDNYYKGFTITIKALGESRTIMSYTGSTSRITFDKPFSADPTGLNYLLYLSLPKTTYMYLPSLDLNGNSIDRNELAYNGYYVIFESYQPTLYSNLDNSNIFYRRVSYYDNTKQIIYFDEPLSFNYDNVTVAQLFTLRQTLPNFRWTPSAPTIINNVIPTGADAVRGPLLGPVIQLPPSAPSDDNVFKGKYVYFYSNNPSTLSPPLPPPQPGLLYGTQNTFTMAGLFYPIYGAYYIRAYNGQTKQLSVDYDINQTPLPTYRILGYSSTDLTANCGWSSITDLGNGVVRGIVTPCGTLFISGLNLNDVQPSLFQTGRNFRVSWRVRKSPKLNVPRFKVSWTLFSNFYEGGPITDDYQTFVFDLYQAGTVVISFINIDWSYVDPMDTADAFIEWDLFQVEQIDPINITTFSNDNYSPLFYSGTMVSLEEAVCYDISLASLSLPNVMLATGSSTAFYPFLYVLLENVTAPSSAGTSLIYSNNPETARALFIATLFPTPDPNVQRFISLGSPVSHTIKFKPNDNLRFSVYLSDGKLFQPLLPPTLSPYPYRELEQIYALFSITRNSFGR